MFYFLLLCLILGIIFQISCLIRIIYTFKYPKLRCPWQNYCFYTFLLNLGILFGIFILTPTGVTHPKPQIKIVKKSIGQKQLLQAKATYSQLSAKQNALATKQKELEQKINDKKQELLQNSLTQSNNQVQPSITNQVTTQKQEMSQNNQSQATQSAQTQDTINTATSQKIIGNKNSKIYHTPDQAGYNILPKNIVYFNSEQEALAAGYRKAKR